MLDLKDDGYLDVRLTSEDGTSVIEQKIDLWETYNRLVDIQTRFKDRPAFEHHAAIAAYLEELGFPPVSHRFACKFKEAIATEVTRLKNSPAGEALPGSPASTASTPSA